MLLNKSTVREVLKLRKRNKHGKPSMTIPAISKKMKLPIRTVEYILREKDNKRVIALKAQWQNDKRARERQAYHTSSTQTPTYNLDTTLHYPI